MPAWPMMPGVPAAGHVTAGGAWHPGRIEGCAKCAPEPPRAIQRGMTDAEIVARSVRWNGDESGSYTPTCVLCRWEGKPRERHSDALAAVRSHFQTIGHAKASR